MNVPFGFVASSRDVCMHYKSNTNTVISLAFAPATYTLTCAAGGTAVVYYYGLEFIYSSMSVSCLGTQASTAAKTLDPFFAQTRSYKARKASSNGNCRCWFS